MIGVSWKLIVVISIITAIFSKVTGKKIPEDAKLKAPALIEKNGYPVELHHVETSDGYILEMHRIPHGIRNVDSVWPKKVVFLQHGLLCSSADFIITGPNNGLAYILADAGFDVWLGNARGNTYSRKHKIYNPDKDQDKFWTFSWHEIGIFDLPAMIDYVLKTTGEKKLYYMGHSQGTTSYYVMCAEKPEYNSKIIIMVSLAPVAYMTHMHSPALRLISTFEPVIGKLFDFAGKYEFLPQSTFLLKAGGKACELTSRFKSMCTNSLFALVGYNEKQFNQTLVPIISASTPAGSSTNQVRHYAQGFISKKFRQFKFADKNKNIKAYGTETPPEYNLTNIVAPMYIFYSKNDWLSNDIDAEQLGKEVPGVKKMILVADKEFNHADYLYGIDAVELVYKPVLKLLEAENIKTRNSNPRISLTNVTISSSHFS